MKTSINSPRSSLWLSGMIATVLLATLESTVQADVGTATQAGVSQINASNWGSVTAPVYGTSETGPYTGAELFAGPNKVGSYFSGVLPNGRIVKPAGVSMEIGMNPLGAALTADGKYLITSNDDERDSGKDSLQNPTNKAGYSLSVVDTATMKVVSQINTAGRFFIGLQITGTGPYTVWASGGGDNNIKLFTVSSTGTLTAAGNIPIAPIQSSAGGYVSNYTPDAAFNTADASGNKPPVPSGFDRVNGAKITFPAGSVLSPEGKYLYVACNGDNSVAVIDTATKTVVKQIPVGYFPYSVAVSSTGAKVFVSNWGITKYKFANPTYDRDGKLAALGTTDQNQLDGFYVAATSTTGWNPKTSSISILSAPGGKGENLFLQGSIYQGHPLDKLYWVGDTHPSATAIVRRGAIEVLYVTKTNSDSLGLILVNNNRKLPDFDLAPITVKLSYGQKVHGAYPNALAVSPDNTRLYVAEAGLNAVAVLDTSNPINPKLLGRLPTGWYPTALALSGDGNTLYIVNAKGVGENINPKTITTANFPPTGLVSYPGVDSNNIFGSVQKVDLTAFNLDNDTVLNNNFAVQKFAPKDTSIVPIGGGPSRKINHVFFILHENKTFDSMLGNNPNNGQFGPFASTTFNQKDGQAYTNGQYTGVSLNTQLLATKFATAVNYYSDAEESDAGHQFASSGTATDYTEKTLLVKSGRGLLVNKNFEPEDYPEGGYIFNNAARHGVSFKDYGAMIRIVGTDTGTSTPTTLDDPTSGTVGYPQLQPPPNDTKVVNPLVNAGDTTSPTQGLGQSYFMKMPVVAVLGGNNLNGEARLDRNYPGYNFNISDQRRAREFIQDFDRMVQAGTLPQFLYIYQPNDHTGSVQAPDKDQVGTSALQQIADGDVALGMVVNHIINSPVYYSDPKKGGDGTGSAIFITYDDAQSSLDHIHPHRTPLIVVSPYAKPGYVGKRHYVTASIVKTEELLLGLPPNNLGDLFATDLRDLFQADYNGITAAQVKVTPVAYNPTPEGQHIWASVSNLDTSTPDRDSQRLGALIRLSLQADELHHKAAAEQRLHAAAYKAMQSHLYQVASRLVRGPAPRDNDD